jgi:hypothetical protein
VGNFVIGKNYPEPEGSDGCPETLVPMLVGLSRISELVLPLWPVGWVMMVVNEFVITLVIDIVVVASTLDETVASMLEEVHGFVRIGVLNSGTDEVATAEDSEIG